MAGTGICCRTVRRAGRRRKDAERRHIHGAESIRENVGQGIMASPPNDLTPRAKLVLNYAAEEANRMSHNYIGTEHILLGLIREGESVGARILKLLAGDNQKVAEAVIDAIGGQEENIFESAHKGVAPQGKKARRRSKLLSEYGRTQWQQTQSRPVISRVDR